MSSLRQSFQEEEEEYSSAIGGCGLVRFVLQKNGRKHGAEVVHPEMDRHQLERIRTDC